MTNRIELNWDVPYAVDEHRYYCSETAIDPENLPVPKEVLASDARSYVDTAVDEDKLYYVAVSSVKNSVEKISGIKQISTSSDPNAAFLTNHLNFETSSLFDKKTGSNWSAIGSISYVPVADKIAISIAKPSFISAPGTLVSANSFTAIFDITFLNEPTFPHQAIMSLGASNSSESIDIFRLNGSGIAAYKGAYGVVGSGVNLPNDVRLLLKIVKKSDNTIKFFINDVLMSTQNFPYDVSSGSRIQIGYNNTDPGRGLNSIIHEFKYYHGKEID